MMCSCMLPLVVQPVSHSSAQPEEVARELHQLRPVRDECLVQHVPPRDERIQIGES